MKITKLLFTVLITLPFLFSCQKPFNDPDPPPQSPGSQLFLPKTYTEDYTSSVSGHSVITFNLSYDASDRLISMISAASPGDKFIYQYSGNTVTMDLYNSNLISIHEIFYLNSSSFIDSTLQYNDTKDTSTEKYLYNSNKQLLKLIEYDYTTATGAEIDNIHNYLYDANGNLIKENDNSGEITYEYSTLLNTLSVGLDLLPRSKYLVKTTSFSIGGTTGILNHTYTFDSSNRLTTEKIVADTGEVAIKTYTY